MLLSEGLSHEEASRYSAADCDAILTPLSSGVQDVHASRISCLSGVIANEVPNAPTPKSVSTYQHRTKSCNILLLVQLGVTADLAVKLLVKMSDGLLPLPYLGGSQYGPPNKVILITGTPKW